MTTVSGRIIKTINYNKGVRKYTIKEKNGKMNVYILFANNKKYPNGLDTSKEITITYTTKPSDRYGDTKVILDVKYGEYVTKTPIILDFLIKNVGITKAYADILVNKYGADTLKIVMNEPDKLFDIKHRTTKDSILKIKKYKNSAAQLNYYIALTELGIMVKYHEDIEKKLGSDIDVIKKSIYKLYTICKMPFKQCDAIAMSLGYAKDNNERLDAFVHMFYKIKNQAGILYVKYDEFQDLATQYQIPMDKLIPKLADIEVDNNIYYTSMEIAWEEKRIERVCDKLIDKNPSIIAKYDDEHYKAETNLDEFQRKAVYNAFSNPISIVTGPPGSGKSYIIKTIASELVYGNMIYVFAPTGAAVERLRSDKLEKDCNANVMTLQSFVYKNCGKKHPVTDMDNKGNTKIQTIQTIETITQLYNRYGKFIIFIDEMSMVSTGLFYSFMEIINNVIDKVRLVLLGDKNQLPSIEGGYVLNDLIDSKKYACTMLKGKYRAKDSNGNINDISINAERVLMGEDIMKNSKNVVLIDADTQEDIEKVMKEVIQRKKIDYRKSSILIPKRNGGICVNTFNPILQDIYNPIEDDDDDSERSDNNICKYRPGDKIIHGKNDKEKDIYNGSIMIVDDVKYENNKPIKMRCKYYSKETDIADNDKEYRMIKYESKNADGENDFIKGEPDLAYATTVHKAQGKGYDTVIVIIHSTMAMLLNKNLIYTAITRARKKCIIISDKEGLIACKKELRRRITNLCGKARRISNAAAKDAIEEIPDAIEEIPDEISDEIEEIPFVDNIIMITMNLDKYIKSKEMRTILRRKGLNIANLKSDSEKYNKEMTKFYNELIMDKKMVDEVMACIKKCDEITYANAIEV